MKNFLHKYDNSQYSSYAEIYLENKQIKNKS